MARAICGRPLPGLPPPSGMSCWPPSCTCPARGRALCPARGWRKRLDEGLARGLILVCAPAGFGKTALLADWARRGKRPVAWLSLDAADNDPARFWRHAVAALDRVRPGIGERVGPLLGPPAPPSFEGLVTALINELAARPGDDEVLLVLDDYHLIDAQPVHESLVFLLEHLPPGLHLVLASRSDPPLPLARLRARGQLAELRAADLRFTAEEAAALLREAAGADLPGTAVAALAARTEGWAAGLQLAALSLRGQPDVAGFVAAFSGSHRYVLDYLAEEVLERQTEQVREFLLETSVLERLSGRLCDAVTGRTDSQAMLEQVERAGPVPGAAGRGARLVALPPPVRRPAPRPAAAGTARPGRRRCTGTRPPGTRSMGWPTTRSAHALAAGRRRLGGPADRAALRRALLRRGEGATMQRWLAALPAELVRLPAAAAAGAGVGWPCSSGRRGGGRGRCWMRPSARSRMRPMSRSSRRPAGPRACWRTSPRRSRSSAPTSPSSAATPRHGRVRLAGPGRARRGRVAAGLDQPGGYLAVAEWLRGRLAEAERAFAVQHRRVAGGRRALLGRLRSAITSARSSAPRAAWTRRSATYQQALEITAAPGRPALPAAGIAYVGLAEVAYQRDELDAALRHVTEGIALCRQLAYTPPLATGLATLAWIRQASGDAAGALEAIGRGRAGRAEPGRDRPAQPRPGAAGAAAAGPGRRGRGRPLDAGARPRPGRRAGLPAGAGVSGAGPGAARPRPPRPRRLRCWSGCTRRPPPRAGPAASSRSRRCGRWRWRPAARRPPRWPPWPRRSPWPARRATSGSSPTRAPPMARPARPAGRGPEGRTGRGPRRPARLPGPAAAARSAAKAAVQGTGRDAAAAVPGLVEPLTARELEVLALLAAGKPNQGIAERAGGQPRHRQEARQPPPGQARRGQPHRGRRPGPRARPDPLAPAGRLCSCRHRGSVGCVEDRRLDQPASAEPAHAPGPPGKRGTCLYAWTTRCGFVIRDGAGQLTAGFDR